MSSIKRRTPPGSIGSEISSRNRSSLRCSDLACSRRSAPNGKPYGRLAPAPITKVVGVRIKACPPALLVFRRPTQLSESRRRRRDRPRIPIPAANRRSRRGCSPAESGPQRRIPDAVRTPPAADDRADRWQILQRRRPNTSRIQRATGEVRPIGRCVPSCSPARQCRRAPAALPFVTKRLARMSLPILHFCAAIALELRPSGHLGRPARRHRS